MASPRCEREAEVLSVVMTGQWPEHREPELAAHISACRSCTDLAVVAAALRDDRRAAMQSAEVPGSGLVWWRIQLRARREQSRAAARTVTHIHVAVVAAALVVALAVLGAMSVTHPFEILLRVGDAFRAGAAGLTGVRILLSFGGLIVLGLVAWLALAPVAVWLAVTDE